MWSVPDAAAIDVGTGPDHHAGVIDFLLLGAVLGAFALAWAGAGACERLRDPTHRGGAS